MRPGEEPGAARPFPELAKAGAAPAREGAGRKSKAKSKAKPGVGSGAATAGWLEPLRLPASAAAAAASGLGWALEPPPAPSALTPAVPLVCSPIWEDVDEAANADEGVALKDLAAAKKLAPYDAVFQGF